MTENADKQATQEFEIANVLIQFTGQTLTPDKVDEIASAMRHAMRDGPCAWAFD